MCTRPISVRLPPNPYEYIRGYRSSKVVQVPCGKCPECLGKRQKDISLRAYREAYKYGSCYFVTLTYAPNHVKFAQTLLDVDTDSGECYIHKSAEICTSDLLPFLAEKYHKAGDGVFIHVRDLVSLENHHFQIVYTPTLFYTDVRLTIKNFRVRYQRKHNSKVDFSYICVGEYGSKKSHRPHYHLLFFGLDRKQVYEFCELWNKGHYYVESVNFKNEDGSDGLAKVASYIGKYAAKGSFNPYTVLQGYTLPCRIASSKGLGLSDMDNLISYYRAYDVAGKYDIEKLDFNYDKNKLYDIIFNRLKYNFHGQEISLPLSFKRKIFNFRLFDGRCVWSRLYYEVMDFARDKYQKICLDEFTRFCSKKSDRTLAERIDEFNNLQKTALLDREKSQKESLSKFYSKSKF